MSWDPAAFAPNYGEALRGGPSAAIFAALLARLPWKRPARVATTGNVTIATGLNAGDTIDGITLAAGDRVLVWQQTDASENGIYIAGSTPARAADFDASDEILGALVYVVAGDTYATILFRNTNESAITVDTDDITFAFAVSPLTTKGDLWGYGTTDDRVPVGADYDVLVSDSGEALGVGWRSGARHSHIYSEEFVGDASQTVFYLANEAELYSVTAYDANGARVPLTQDTTELDKVTFDAAPAAGTGWFDYIPLSI